VDMNTLDINGPAGLLNVLGQVPEHRKARGIRHDLAAVLAVATAAVLSGADSTAAIAHYAHALTQPALASQGIRRNTRTRTYVAPAYQTLRRAIRSVDAHALDTAVTSWLHAQLSTGHLSSGQLTRLILALDGKTVRGAKDTTGNQLHPFAALIHGEATVIAQHPLDTKTNELTGFIPLLDQITEHHKPDQYPDHKHDHDNSDWPALDALPWTTIKIGHTEQDKGHGRRDRRVLKVIDLTNPAPAHHRVGTCAQAGALLGPGRGRHHAAVAGLLAPARGRDDMAGGTVRSTV
jgi:hypothetical protein